jgi:ferredoxin-NADP reductase
MDEYIVMLKDRKQVAQDTMAFWFDVAGSGYTFRAVQNAAFTLLDPPETDAAGNIRTLSVASAPSAPNSLMVAMRMRKIAFKNSLKMLPLGAKLRVSSPIGSFTLHRDGSRPAVFLAGGIGITPVLSILAHATEQGLIAFTCSIPITIRRRQPFLASYKCGRRKMRISRLSPP